MRWFLTRRFGRGSVTSQSKLRRAVVETLEQRRLLSITPSISGNSSVTEGSGYVLTLAYTGSTPQQWDVNWGDGYDPDGNGDGKQRFTGSPASVTHKYADGATFGTSRTITATAHETGGATYNSNSKSITVDNYRPVAGISGSNFAYTNRPYTLSLLDYDPGDDTISAWKINWGDGSPEQTFTGDPDQVTHTYTATSGNHTITAKVVDEDGTFPWINGEFNRRTITVLNQSPADELLVDSRSAAVVTGSVTLTAGVTYKLVGSGWGSMDLYHQRRMDPEYYDYQTGSPIDVASGNVDVGITRVNPSTGASIATYWGAYNASHVYEMEIIGDGLPLALKFIDRANYYFDNAGTLAVAVFAVAEVRELTVAADGDPENRGRAATPSAIDFHLAPDPYGSAAVVIDGLVSPDDATTKAKSLWTIDAQGNFASRTAGTFNDSASLRTITLSNEVSDQYTITAGADDNGNGLLESSEVERTVNLHLAAPQTVEVGPEVIDFQIGTYEASGEPASNGGGGEGFAALADDAGFFSASPHVPLNNDYDEQNRDINNNRVPDNIGNAASPFYGGHRIRDGWDAGVSDSELRVAILRLAPTFTGPARWKINLPDSVKLWHWWPNGSRTRPGVAHWGLVINDQFSMPDAMPQTYVFMIEGITPSTGNEVTATLVPESTNATEYVNPGTPVAVVSADLDVDSDNDDGFSMPDRSAAEEYNEDVPHALADPAEAPIPGKTVALNSGDADGDGVVDYADGFDLDGVSGNADDASTGVSFVPLVLELPEPLDLSAAMLRLSYSGSGPAAMTGTTPGAGHLRVWTKNGSEARDGRSVTAGGDYVTPGTFFTAGQLGLSSSNRTVTLWMEAISATSGGAEEDVRLEISPSGNTTFDPPTYDRVRVDTRPIVMPPPAPDGLRFTDVTSSSVTLSWNDNSASEEDFLVKRSSDAGQTWQQFTVPANVTSFTDTGLTPDADYRYQVCARNEGGAACSAQADVRTLPSGAGSGGTSGPTITLTASDAEATEGGTNRATFVVSRSGPTTDDLVVLIGPPAGTAVESDDYVALPRSVMIEAGRASTSFNLTPIDDGFDEPHETVTVFVELDSAYVVGTPFSASAIIRDDDDGSADGDGGDGGSSGGSGGGSSEGGSPSTQNPTAVVDMVGTNTPFGQADLVDLTSYENITRIEIVNVTDPAGLVYDDFSFDVGTQSVGINFDDLPVGALSNQYPDATFYSSRVYDSNGHDYGGSGRQAVASTGGFNGPLFINFTKPVNNLKFFHLADNFAGIIAQIRVFTAKVESVTWETFKPDPQPSGWKPIPLDDSPPTTQPTTAPATQPTQGLRIFPEKTTADDAFAAERNKVWVSAKVPNVKAGTKVYFRIRDADDPSSDEDPIDANGPLGNDNRKSNGETGEGSIDGAAETDEKGIARFVFTIDNPQPGNNYRAFASTSQEKRDGLSSLTMDSTDPLPDGVKKSDLLTVWQTLHVEVDSMGAEPRETVFLQGDAPRGDIPDPDISALPDAFRPAFIVIKRDTGKDDNDLPWRMSFPNMTERNNYFIHQDTGHRGTKQEMADYWTAYVCGIYEYGPFVDDAGEAGDDGDNDPAGETASLGATLGYDSDEPRPLGSEASTVSFEILEDVAAVWGWTAAEKQHVLRGTTLHEIAHQFEAQHTAQSDNVMWVPGNDLDEDVLPTRPFVFADASLATIRGIAMP